MEISLNRKEKKTISIGGSEFNICIISNGNGHDVLFIEGIK